MNKDKDAKMRKRKEEDAEAREERLEERKKKRAREEDKVREERLAAVRTRMERLRAREDEEEREERRRKDKQAKEDRRKEEEEDEREERLADKRRAMERQRAEEDEEEREERRRKDREAKAVKKSKNENELMNIARSSTALTDPRFKVIDIGSIREQRTCEFCNAYLWPTETNHACCGGGKLYNKNDKENETKGMKIMPDLPDELLQLKKIPAYIENIRNYNNAMAMASLGSNMPSQNVNFKIQGKLHHSIGSIGPPPEGEKPKFSALYFNDTDHEIENRMSHQSKKLKPDIIKILQTVLKRDNNYIKSFRQALEIHGKDDDVKVVLLADRKKKEKRRQAIHPGCLSLPQGCEVRGG